MTPLDELRSGQLGNHFVKLLYRQLAVAARRGQFPPPSEHPNWNLDAIVETAHDYLADGSNYAGLTEIAARVEDDEGLRNYLTTALTNYLRSIGRKTTVGKLVRRLRDRMKDDERFSTVPAGAPGAGNVVLAGETPLPYSGSLAPLADAASQIELNVVRWRADARREGPLADTPALLDMCVAALRKAEGSLSVGQLAESLAPRLGIDPRSVPATIPVEDIGQYLTPDAVQAATGQTDSLPIDTADAVLAILNELSDRETLVLATLHERIRTIADQTGMPVSTAGAVKQRVQLKVSTILRHYSDPQADEIAIAARDTARHRVGLDPV